MSIPRYIQFLSCSLLVIAWTNTSADSYPKYRMDDASLLSDGNIRVRSLGRSAQTLEDPPKYKSWSGFYTSLYSSGRGFSQKGGVQSDAAAKTSAKASLSPELGWIGKSTTWEGQFLVSPYLTYMVKDDSQTKIYRLTDGEAIGSLSLRLGGVGFRAEGGRGFQRLDSAGFLFASIANYAEFGWSVPSWKIRGGFIGLEFQSQFSYLPRDTTQSPLRVKGGDFLWEPEHIIKSLRFFYYQYSEPRQEPVKASYFQTAEPFRAYGFFRYSGIEWEFLKFKEMKFDGSAFHVEGRRENGTDAFNSYDTRQATNAWMGTLSGTLESESYSVFARVLYATKDRTFRTDHDSNGFAGIKGDPRGFLAPVSILLLRDFQAKQDSPFYGIDSVRTPNYENSGMQYYQTGIRKELDGGWSMTLATGIGISYIGRGLELIAAGGWKGELGYLLLGAAYAWVKPGQDESYILDEIRRPIAVREYFRWYASAGIRF
ncbi:hypothetical protein LEP1GSC047_4080 [Leptospira inadai serovar Lyme str. 10]|uniref:Alginate export domain-containing protein n=1 Tax=Leptospira inadai serovar Lyme str. 10 TaxID=1049790 RepID=V6HWT5_9LEPT|nr:hypothetical protein [Leptospira inadai]EQA37434.1 hypothetical protein LEP1GSC047_4080 [Leptospira inadai serovar Lyme str. 10]